MINFIEHQSVKSNPHLNWQTKCAAVVVYVVVCPPYERETVDSTPKRVILKTLIKSTIIMLSCFSALGI